MSERQAQQLELVRTAMAAGFMVGVFTLQVNREALIKALQAEPSCREGIGIRAISEGVFGVVMLDRSSGSPRLIVIGEKGVVPSSGEVGDNLCQIVEGYMYAKRELIALLEQAAPGEQTTLTRIVDGTLRVTDQGGQFLDLEPTMVGFPTEIGALA